MTTNKHVLCITVLYWFLFWLCPPCGSVPLAIRYSMRVQAMCLWSKEKSIISPRFLEWDGFYWSTACVCVSTWNIKCHHGPHCFITASPAGGLVLCPHKNDWTFHYKGQGKCLGTPIINVTKVSSPKNFTNLLKYRKNIYKGPFKKTNITTKQSNFGTPWSLRTVFHRCSQSILSLFTSESRYEIIGSIHDDKGHSLIIRPI